MPGRPVVVLLLVAALSLVVALGGVRPDQPGYTTDFGLAVPSSLVSDGANPYFSLQPGAFRRYEGTIDGEFVEVDMTVLDETRAVPLLFNGQRLIVRTRVIEEREWIDGELAEVALNYYARCTRTGNIYYFGEDVELYENGELVSEEGTWLAGRNGAMPGLYMPGHFLLGSRYHQELAPHVSMDRAEHVDMGFTVETPAGVFDNCVMVLETTPLEEDEETLKVYSAEIGLIIDDTLELVDYSG